MSVRSNLDFYNYLFCQNFMRPIAEGGLVMHKPITIYSGLAIDNLFIILSKDKTSMPSLIGEERDSTSEDLGLGANNSSNAVIPEYVEDAEIQAWLHLQEQLKLASRHDNDPICSANRSGSEFSLKAFLLNLLQLSGHILSDERGVVTPQLKSRHESSSHADTGIIVYKQHQPYPDNASYTRIPSNDDTTALLLPNNNNTNKQDMQPVVSVPRYSNTTDKQHDDVDLLASLESQGNIASSGSSYIELSQVEIVRLSSTTAIASIWYKYPLRTLYVGIPCVGLYYAYNKIWSFISNTHESIEEPMNNQHEELPEPDMLLDRNNGRRSEFGGNLGIGIRNIEIQEEPSQIAMVFGHINIIPIESSDSNINKTSTPDFGHISVNEFRGENGNIIQLAPGRDSYATLDDDARKQAAIADLSNSGAQKEESVKAKLEITISELQYDQVIKTNHKLNISHIVLSSIDRNFYNKYFFYILQDTISANDGETYSSSQFIKQLFLYIVDEIAVIADTKPLIKMGLTSYLYKLYSIISTMQQAYPEQVSNYKKSTITKVYDSFYDSVIVDSSMISNITLANLDTRKFFIKLITESSNDQYIPTPESIANVMTFTKQQLYSLPALYSADQDMLNRAIESASAEIYNLGQQLVTDTDPNNIYYYKTYINQYKLKMVMQHSAQSVGYSTFAIMCSIIIYYKILPEFKDVAMQRDSVNEVSTLDIKSPSSDNSLAEGNANYTSVSGADTTNQLQDSSTQSSISVMSTLIVNGSAYTLSNKTHSEDSLLYFAVPPGAAAAAAAAAAYKLGAIAETASFAHKGIDAVLNGDVSNTLLTNDDISGAGSSMIQPLCDLERAFNNLLGVVWANSMTPEVIIALKERYLDGVYGNRAWSVYHPANQYNVPLYAVGIYDETVANVYLLLEKYRNADAILKQGDIIGNKYLVHYMMQALDTDNKEIIRAALIYIGQAVQNGLECLTRYINNKFHNIAIASSEQILFQDEHGRTCYVTTLDETQLNKCPFAFVMPGSDSLNMIADHSLGSIDIMETIMHEISHITHDGLDLFYVPTDISGTLPNAVHARMYIQKSLQHGYCGARHLIELAQGYAETCNDGKKKLSLNEACVRIYQEYRKNEAFRARLLYANADTLALYIRDISIMRPSS